MKKILLVSAFSSALILSACSSDDAAQIIADEFVTVSGLTTNVDGAVLSGVDIEGVYTDPGGLLNPTTKSATTTGIFTLPVIKGDTFYLRSTISGYATVNSAKGALSANEAGVEIGIPTESEAQSVIDAAYGAGTALETKAWLVVDVSDAAGEVNNETIGVSIPLDHEVYTNCDGSDSGATATVACLPDRQGPMYIASFISTTEAQVTVGTETQTAPLRMGEITVLEFEQ